jgi:hypothetical protein
MSKFTIISLNPQVISVSNNDMMLFGVNILGNTETIVKIVQTETRWVPITKVANTELSDYFCGWIAVTSLGRYISLFDKARTVVDYEVGESDIIAHDDNRI